jgi:hypothetical protein
MASVGSGPPAVVARGDLARTEAARALPCSASRGQLGAAAVGGAWSGGSPGAVRGREPSGGHACATVPRRRRSPDGDCREPAPGVAPRAARGRAPAETVTR